MRPITRFAVVAALFSALPASAATATGTLRVTATLAGACAVTTRSIDFGTGLATPIGSDIDAQGALVTTCANGVVYTLSGGVGNGAGASFANRRMRRISGTELLNYSLYTTAARTTVWGDGTAGTATIAGTANGAAQTIPVYARIPAGQTAPSGQYFDVITVTVTF